MDEVEKSKIRLSHWIGHNLEHLTGYIELAELLENQGLTGVANKIRSGVGLVEKANKEFEEALSMLGGAGEVMAEAHSHHHKHEHSHGDETHAHEHSHSHGHCGLHKHDHDD